MMYNHADPRFQCCLNYLINSLINLESPFAAQFWHTHYSVFRKYCMMVTKKKSGSYIFYLDYGNEHLFRGQECLTALDNSQIQSTENSCLVA